MGKTRDLLKKLGDIQGIFNERMGMIQDRSSEDLTEAEDIKKRWQEYTEELYNKSINDPNNHNGVLTHLEPDILECEVKWTLGINITNRAIGGNVIPAELFQILKDDAVKVLHSTYQQIWKISSATRLEKVSFHFNPKKEQCQRMFKLPHNCTHFTCQQGNTQNPSSQASAVCEPRTSRCISWILKRQRNQRSNCQHYLGHRESKGIAEKLMHH